MPSGYLAGSRHFYKSLYDSKDIFTNKTYSCGKFSLLSDSLEFDFNTFILKYYLAFKGFRQWTG